MPRTIWTIGYGGRKPTGFVELLRRANVDLIVDVRLTPRGSMGSYTRAMSPERGIQRLLAEAEIGYEWLPELGNPDRGDPEMARFRAEIVPEFATRTKQLIDLAASKRVCLMCGCKQASTCHRALITEWLAPQGWEVLDL